VSGATTRSLIYRRPWVYETVMRGLYRRNYEARYRALAALIPQRASVVELCCGPGALYRRHLAAKHVHYVGLDSSPPFVGTLRAAGIDAREWDVRSSQPLPRADYALMQASLYQFMADAPAILDRMMSAAAQGVIVAEPIRNLSTSAGTLGRRFARFANPGDGAPVDRYTEESLALLLEPFSRRLQRTFLLPGGRERAYLISTSDTR
jgi:SAM-dependent methyltransferase